MKRDRVNCSREGQTIQIENVKSHVEERALCRVWSWVPAALGYLVHGYLDPTSKVYKSPPGGPESIFV
jgi:hypothetical protein